MGVSSAGTRLTCCADVLVWVSASPVPPAGGAAGGPSPVSLSSPPPPVTSGAAELSDRPASRSRRSRRGTAIAPLVRQPTSARSAAPVGVSPASDTPPQQPDLGRSSGSGDVTLDTSTGDVVSFPIGKQKVNRFCVVVGLSLRNKRLYGGPRCLSRPVRCLATRSLEPLLGAENSFTVMPRRSRVGP
jgi:hypothetical protein